MPNVAETRTQTRITVARGDGIGPEIMDATLQILSAAGAGLEYEFIEIGEQVYKRGVTTGIEPESWESLRRNKVFLKAPITTPQGGGFKSLNVTTRKAFGLYANVRPCVSYHPFVDTLHPAMDVVIVRENEEDLYAGIEHQHTDQVVQCLKLISRPGSERICRYAFEYARAYGRKKVTCFTKDNIMKLTDGLFHRVFDEVAKEYPEIANEHWIVDIGAAKLADTPNAFDVVVLPNLYGDILSDVAAQIAGSVGLAGSANIGDGCAMFEAIHGSAPRRAGQDLANPSGLLLGAVMMLVHLGKGEVAARVHNAWLKTLEDGIHTYDIYKEGVSRRKVGTREFADAVVARLGSRPATLKAADYSGAVKEIAGKASPVPQAHKELVGVDVYLHARGNYDPTALGNALQNVEGEDFELQSVGSRGISLWPQAMPGLLRTDQLACRYMGRGGRPLTQEQLLSLLGRVVEAGHEIIQTLNLYHFDGHPGFTRGHGQ